MERITRHFCVGILVVAAFSITAAAQTNLTNGLVLYFPFDGNANDASGHGNHGVVNGPTLETDRFGRSSSAYKFTALGDYIITSNTNGIPVSTNDFTVSLWVNVMNDSAHHILLCNTNL